MTDEKKRKVKCLPVQHIFWWIFHIIRSWKHYTCAAFLVSNIIHDSGGKTVKLQNLHLTTDKR